MIVFNNWTITVTGLIARQYDNLSRRIDVEGDLPDGYTWQLLVQSGGNADILLLQSTENGVGVVLTADNLSKSGKYYFQLRGVLEADGVTKRHTNVVSAHIPKSLTGVGTWPEVPTEFYQVESNILELYQHPPIPGSNGYWLVWDPDADEYVESQLPLPEATAGGTSDHSKLKNRDAADQHPMSAITGLVQALEGKQPVGSYITEESDPTVPEWAKQPQKPAYTAQEVGALPSTTAIPSTAADVNAEPSGAVSQHNVSDAAHSDIRLLISGLTDRLNALADSNDTTLDQLSEIVAYIKSNRDLISAITTDKVSVADIIDNLTTNVANKPLSAAQGVALKALIDAITVPDKLPNPNALTFTGAVTGSYDGSAPLSVKIPSGGTNISLGLTSAAVGQIIKVKAVDDSGKPTAWEAVDMPSGGGGDKQLVTLKEDTLTEDAATIDIDGFSVDRLMFAVAPYGSTANSGNVNGLFTFGFSDDSSININMNSVFVSNKAGKSWNKHIFYATVNGNVLYILAKKETGAWDTNIDINMLSNFSGSFIRMVLLPQTVKITSLSIGLSSTGVIGANTQFKVVGA